MKFSAKILAAPLAALTLASVAASPASAQDLVYWGQVGVWDVLIDPSLGNGCLIQAEFDNGSLVRIGFDRIDEVGYVTVFNEAWGDIAEGEVYAMAFTLDGQAYEGEGYGFYLGDVPGIDIVFDNEDFLFDIARRRFMTFFNAGGEVMTINLAGTSAGLNAAVVCQNAQR